MDNETQQIFAEQIIKLPNEVVDFILSSPWDADADEIGALYNLPPKEMTAFKREVIFVLIGLVHPDAFMETLETEVDIKGAVLEALVLNVNKKIFEPIRPALISFFEKESAVNTPEKASEEETQGATLEAATDVTAQTPTPAPSEFTSAFSAIIQPTPVRTWEKAPEVIPDNLPTEETTQSFLPNLTPKTVTPTPEPTAAIAEPEAHPFEEKMKKTFTAGQQSIGELVIEPAQPKATPTYHVDPYREPIE